MEQLKVLKSGLKQYGMIVALVAIYLIFAVATNGANLSAANINNLVMQNSYVVILAIGMLLCVLTGNIDLGVGSVVAVTGAIAGILLVDLKVNMCVAVFVALLFGVVSGAFAGFFISYLDIPAFVVTLATMLMGRGLTFTLLQAQTKGPLPENFLFIGAGFLPTVKFSFGETNIDLISIFVGIVFSLFAIGFEIRKCLKNKKYGFYNNPIWMIVLKEATIVFIIMFFFYKLARWNGLPFVLIIMIMLVAIYSFVTMMTVGGRQIYALGANRQATHLSGINTEKVLFWLYVNMGFLSAVAGIVLAARNASASPKAGDGFEMDAIAACYIGGAAVSGGTGSIAGAVVGAFVMGVLNNGMSLYGWSTDIQKIVKGAVLLGAVTFDVLSKRRKQ